MEIINKKAVITSVDMKSSKLLERILLLKHTYQIKILVLIKEVCNTKKNNPH